MLTGILLYSCTVVKKYPKNNAFHFENNIKIEGELSKERKAEIKSDLLSQLEDSIAIKKASKIPWPSFPWIIPVSVIEQPAAFNNIKLEASLKNMKNLMSSLGYRRSDINADTIVKIKKEQKRVYTEFTVTPGPSFILDSISIDFPTKELQTLAGLSTQKSVLKRGSVFNYGSLDQEISRLTEVFQNNGYYKISKEDIIAEADTSWAELFNSELDPLELALYTARIEEKKQKPEVDILLRFRANRDSTHLQSYTIGKVIVFPDSSPEGTDSSRWDGMKDSSSVSIVSNRNSFDPIFIRKQIQLIPGNTFRREDYNKTLFNFNKLGSWQNINIASEVDETKKEINYTLRLQPAKKQFFSIDLEGRSIINTSQLIQVGSGRVGLANNFTLRNRNIGRRSIQLENNLRTGIEFNNFQKILSGEITLTNRLSFPWLVSPLKFKPTSVLQQARTVASVDFSYIDRFRFFNLNSINVFWGYEWKPTPNSTWQFRPINIESTRFSADSLFLESIKDFPLLLYTYNNGLIVGMNAQFNRNLTPSSSKKINLLKIYAEESGILSGALFYQQTKPGKLLSNLYRFVKMDIEFKHIVTHQNSSMHFRAYAGGGLSFTTGSRKGEVTLPFFKSFFAGGPNSMRGWAIRKLGIGSNVFYDTVANGRFNDKYADLQLETNLEWRFNLFPFYGFMMRGALFTDIGNIWFRNELNGTLKGAGIRLDRLGKDLAIASGFGARMDFNYFLLRFDLGFPIKDPRYGPDKKGNPALERFYSPNNGGWFTKNVWNKPVFQFAIGYPF